MSSASISRPPLTASAPWWTPGQVRWAAARVDMRQVVHESRALPRSYFQGLNFLLNEQPDKAIESFIEVVRVDPETVELHFALGSLFRRRGETELAFFSIRKCFGRESFGGLLLASNKFARIQ